MTVNARSTDPETSHAAANAVSASGLRASQALVLNMFVAYGPMHDKDLLDRVHATQKQLGLTKLMSPSGVRSRRSELSKPNMERMAEIAREISGVPVYVAEVHHGLANAMTLFTDALNRLRVEGFRSTLIDNGKRETVDGHRVVVWEIAR